MASHLDDDYVYPKLLAELKQINKKLSRQSLRPQRCKNCYYRNVQIKQLKVEKIALLNYIKELETALKVDQPITLPSS